MERALGLPFINHSTALQCKEIVGERRWEARFSFSLVRNPYLRLASMYAYRSAPSLQKGSSGQFCKWLEDIAKKNRSGNAGAKISPQIFWLANQDGKIIVDKWYKLEEVYSEQHDLEQRLGFSLNLERLNQQPRMIDYRELYSTDAISLVREIYADDFRRFGYSNDFSDA